MLIAGRQVTSELMDDPSLDPVAHRAALRGLANINSFTHSSDVLGRRIRSYAKNGAQPLRVLDVACGGGDVTVALQQHVNREGLDIRLHGCDISPTALQHARQNASDSGVEIDFFRLDVLNEPIPTGYDIIVSSLFFHHLSNEQAESLLRNLCAATTCVLISDLERLWIGHVAAWLGARFLSRSPVVHFDGPASVRAAFSKAELKALAEKAGLCDARVCRWWPFRLLLEWSKL